MVIHPKLLLCVLLWMQRKESQMDHGQLSMVADKFQWVFSEALLNACGKEVRFCRRQRAITPFRLGLCVFHGFLPPSPRECCHVIHGNVATQSRGFLPSIPREYCHPVYGMAATLGA